MQKLNRFQAVLEVKSIIGKNSSAVSVAAIDVDQYLDYLETLFSDFNWKEATWVERIKSIWGIGDIVIELYKDIIDETASDREQVFVDLALVGWSFVKEKFNIKLPMLIAPFEKKIIETLVRAAVKFALSKLEK